MDLSPIQYVGISMNLCIQIFKKWKEQGGKLTQVQKNQVLLVLEILTGQLLRCISDLRRELGEFGGELEVPRVQHGCLEYKCADADDEGDPWDPLGEPGVPG